VPLNAGVTLPRTEPVSLYDADTWQLRRWQECSLMTCPADPIPAAFVATIPDCRILGAEGSVIAPDDSLLAEVSVDLGVVIANDASSHASLQTSRQPAAWKIDGAAAVLAVLGGENYFHWMVHLLPRVHLLQAAGLPFGQINNFVVNRVASLFQVQTLAELGVPRERIIETSESTHLLADRLFVPARPSRMSDMPRWVCDFLRSRFLPNSAPVQKFPERIYVARTNVRPRFVENHHELEKFLSGLGFETVGLESLSISEQAQIFAHAKVIVAPHGAGLTNLVFSEPGTTVIEIFGPRYINACYWAMSNWMSSRYFFVLGEGDGPNEGKAKVFDLLSNMTVDLGALKRTLALANVI
jgi:capsular polysaccharide biosynthesis protein